MSTTPTDAWGRPIVTEDDGHGAYECNDAACALHPGALYGPVSAAPTPKKSRNRAGERATKAATIQAATFAYIAAIEHTRSVYTRLRWAPEHDQYAQATITREWETALEHEGSARYSLQAAYAMSDTAWSKHTAAARDAVPGSVAAYFAMKARNDQRTRELTPLPTEENDYIGWCLDNGLAIDDTTNSYPEHGFRDMT